MKAFFSAIDLHEFFVEGRDAQSSQVILHITEPANEAEYERGYLFMVAEANQASPKTIKVLNRWIEELETGFYDEPMHNVKPAVHFEKLLDRLNKRSGAFLRDLRIQEEDLHVVIGFINSNTLSFAMRGQPFGYVAYKEKSGDYKAIDVASDDRGADEDEQLFADIVAGDIHDSDRVFFATPHIDDAFSNMQLVKVISSKSPKKGAKHFQNALEDVDNGYSFGGLVIEKKPEHDEPAKALPTKKKPQESLRDLLSTQRDTEQILAPSILGKLKARLDTNEDEDVKPEQRKTQTKINTKGRTKATAKGFLHQSAAVSSTVGKKTSVVLWSTAKWLAITSITLVQTLFYVTTNVGGRRAEFIAHWKRVLGEGWEKEYRRFIQMNLLSRIMLVAGVAFVIVFLVSVNLLRFQKQKETEIAAYRAQITLIESKLNAAESSLIYGEEDVTRGHVQDVVEKLTLLPNKSKNEQETYTRLSEALETIQEKIRHAVHVGTSELLDTAQHNLTDPQDILVTTGLIVITDSSQQTLALERGTQTTRVTPGAPATSPFIATATDEDQVFFIGNTSAQQWKYQGESETYSLSVPGAGTITDAVVYNDRLYSLVAEQNQVFKHDRYQNGINDGSPWINGETVLKEGGVSIAIDGSIWILMRDGTIRVFDRGNQKDITFTSVDPVLTSPTHIWTAFESDWLYIFEPEHKRIVIFDKDGVFSMQYVFDDAQDPRAFAIDETTKQGFILDGTRVQQFVLNHL